MSEKNGSQEVKEEGSAGGADDDNGDHNGYVHVGPTYVPAEGASVFVESVNDSTNQEHIEHTDGASASAGDSIQRSASDIRVMEDGGKEDMFVDCPDEIEGSEIQLATEEKDDGEETQIKELDNGPEGHDLMAEIEHLRNMLEKTAGDRDSFAQKYEEERAAFMEQLNQLQKYQHIEGVANRILTSLASAVYQEEMLDESITGKMSHVEKATALLLEKYTLFCSEIDQLRGCLVEVAPDKSMQDEVGTFVTARETTFEFRGKVIDLDQKLSQAEDENKQLVEELDKQKATFENANAEIAKLNAELEHEKTKFANTKEKLSLAVTKGKQLVQQRDSLKQSLADKTSELEKCLIELQEKSSALEAAEQSKELLMKNEVLAASLREALMQKETILQQCGEILLEATATEELQSMDIIEKVRWLTNERKEMRDMSLVFHRLADALSTFHFPETVKSNGIDFQVAWLLESLNMGKEDVAKWQHETFRTKEAANSDIDRLTTLLLAETQEKDYLWAELEDLRSKYEGIVQKEFQALMEKARIVNILLETSGVILEDQEKDYQSLSDVSTIIDKCISKIKENTISAFDFRHVELEDIEKFQILLYIRDIELTLYGQIFEEEMLDKAELSSLSDELVASRNELSVLKDEKDSLQKDLERSEEKAALLREKLSMAVKKGKGLVQERENLKKMLDERNTEIENLKLEVKQQVSACNDYRDQIDKLSADVECIPKLEVDVLAIEEQRNEVEKFLLESNSMLQKVFESIDGIVLPGDSVFEEPIEKVRWIAGYFSECQLAKIQAEQELEKVKDEANALASKLDEVQMTVKLLQDSLSVAENKTSELLEEKKELEVSKTHIKQELQKATVEAFAQTNELIQVCASQIKEAANNDIGRLTTLLLAETQEKDYLQAELEDLRSKCEGIVQKAHQDSKEKDRIVKMLLEASGVTLDDHSKSDMAIIIDKCIAMIKDNANSAFEFSHIGVESFEKFQILLYIRDMEVTLNGQICEEEILDKAELSCLSNELVLLRNELVVLKGEKDTLQKDLERSEEKAALLREKLSMAVKKGKGLFQERENLKKVFDEKNTEIENLKLELERQLSVCNDYRDQIDKLTADVERIPKLEADVIAFEERRNEVEKFLLESNSMLQSVFESIDGIVLPDMVFEEPIEKVKWMERYYRESQSASIQAEQELRKAKDEISALSSKLDEFQMTMKSMQDALSVAESKISQLLEEKEELEASKKQTEQELQKAIEEALSQTNKFAEVCASQKSLEESLRISESDISMLNNEKEEALASRAAAEMEMQKVKEGISIYTSKLSDADKIILSLEDALSHAKENASLLAEDNRKAINDKTNLEQEMKKLKDEVETHVVRFTEANSTIKSLENSLLNAETKISDLLKEKNNAEEEISALNLKLNSCMQELAGTHGSSKNRFLELSSHLTSLRRLMKDETLASLFQQSFEEKISYLNDMNILLGEIRDQILETDSEMLRKDSSMEDDFSTSTFLSAGLGNMLNVEMAIGEEITADDDNIVFHIGKNVEGLHLKDKVLTDKVKGISTFMDNLIASLLTKLQATKNRFIAMQELIKSLKQKVNDTEMDRQALKNTVLMLESGIGCLLPACTDVTKELESEYVSCLSLLRSNSELGKLDEALLMELGTVGVEAAVGDQLELESNKYSKAAEELLSAARRSRNFNLYFRNVVNKMITTIEDLQNELNEIKRTSEEVLEERNLCQTKISKLENDYQEKCKTLNEREAEFSSLNATSLKKIQDAEDSLLSTSQMKSLFYKINRIEVSLSELEDGDLQLHSSADVRKLFYVVDSYTELKQETSILSQDKEYLQSTLERHLHEIDNLKEVIGEQQEEKDAVEKLKSELLDFATGVEKIIQKLGGGELIELPNAAEMTELLRILEKLVLGTKMESENFKSKVEELGAKLLETQKFVDDLSSKIRLLEDSSQFRVASPETVQARGISGSSSLPAQSEISEIQDTGPVGVNKAIPSVPPAAHPRTLRKGSSDHLAINIDSESKRLISEDADEDKGHTFKSLNTSGLIPRQGKMIADRVDGIWVSGSRALMSHPRARLGLITYWLFIHLWLLGTIL